MNYILGAVACGVVFWFLSRGNVTVENLSDVMKKVTVDGRSYLVTKLGGGLFNVTSTVSPQNSITIDQVGEKAVLGDVAQLRTDMKRFPDELFKDS